MVMVMVVVVMELNPGVSDNENGRWIAMVRLPSLQCPTPGCSRSLADTDGLGIRGVAGAELPSQERSLAVGSDSWACDICDSVAEIVH